MLVQSGYSLTCTVNEAEHLNVSITYQWTKNNGTQTQLIRKNEADPRVLSFSSLRLSDAGWYTCQATVSSPYLNNDITMMDTQDVILQSEFSYNISHLCILLYHNKWGIKVIYSPSEGYKGRGGWTRVMIWHGCACD